MGLKHKIRIFLTQNKAMASVYEKYHEMAKYVYARKQEKVIVDKDCILKAVNEDNTQFFGYYDKPCIRNNHSITHRVNTDSLKLNQEIDILLDGKKISSTKCWNWQQGCMLSWLDDDRIIHNYFDGYSYKSKIININSKEERIIDFPIYSVSKNGEFALSLNFSRLAALRPDYGYFNLDYTNIDKVNDSEGIFYIDLINNTHKLLVSLQEIASFESDSTMINATHKVNHIDVSKDGEKCIFLHRWYDEKNKKRTRLILLYLNTLKMKVLANQEMVSHCAWLSDEKIIGYLRGNNGKDGYFILDLNGNQEQFLHELLVDDGHPTVYDERFVVSDSYPDHTCRSKLLLLDIEKRDVQILGEFYSPMKYKGTVRCDLHPRFNYHEKKITFDSVYTGKRNCYELDLCKLIDEKQN